MLEILLIITLSRRLAGKAVAKGHSKAWGALAGGLWLAGEIVGLIVGFAIGLEIGAYGLGLLGAAAGAAIAFVIVGNLDARAASFELAEAEPVGHFDPANPYSPPGTYRSS